MNSKITFREILKAFKPEPLGDGEACHIISKMTTERVGKGKKDRIYKIKHKNYFKTLDF